jgi:uncharacterized protein involved in exopolysaccharide biosynthesis
MAQPGKIDLRRLLQIARRWKWLLIVPPIIAVIGAYAYVATMPPQFTSSTTILLGSNQYVTSELGSIVPGTKASRFRMADMKENIAAQMMAHNILGKAIERSGLKPSQGMRNRAKELLRVQPDGNEEEIIRKLQIDWLAKRVETGLFFPKRGNYFQVSITHSNPETAYLLTKTLAEVFIEESLIEESLGPQHTLVWAQQQLDDHTRMLEEARERLRQFKTGVIREQARLPEGNLHNGPQIIVQIKALQVDISTTQGKLRELESQLGALKNRAVIQLSPKATALRGLMIEKISNVALLLLHASWKDPQVIKLNQEIAGLREQLLQEIQATGANGLANSFSPQDLDRLVQRQMVLTDLEMLNRNKSVLDDLLQSYKKGLSQQPAQDLQLSQLESEVDNLQEKVSMFEKQVEAIKYQQALRNSDAEVRYNIQDPANMPITPTNAASQKVLLMAFMGGLGLGVGVIYLFEFFDNSFKSVEEVEQILGLTVLGTVPKLDFSEKSLAKKGIAVSVAALSLVTILALVFVLIR